VNAHDLKYVLVTPARNEEAFIEGAIRSVVAQTVRPVRWIIVSDGSTDRTDSIVQQYVRQFPWIELLRMPEHRDRQFAAKANCFMAAYARLQESKFDVVGNLDADITFGPDYYEFLLGQLAERPKLGVTGTPFVEDAAQPGSHSYAHGAANLTHVSGACQLFRRKCFEDVGGYVPIKGGAIDWIAVTTARMRGWETRTFLERVCFHHRKIGTGNHSPLVVKFHYGRKAYYVGGHPLWETIRGLFQFRDAPWIIGGLYFIGGYWWSAATRMHRPVSKELMTFHRGEQMIRLRGIFRRSRAAADQNATAVASHKSA
jgi:glycosyltransferase involved in cell wall biosynthesis